MSNGEVCCILGVCCPPDSATRRDKVVAAVAALGLDPVASGSVADWFIGLVDPDKMAAQVKAHPKGK